MGSHMQKWSMINIYAISLHRKYTRQTQDCVHFNSRFKIIISSEKLKRGWTLTTTQYTITHILYFKTQRTVIENTKLCSHNCNHQLIILFFDASKSPYIRGHELCESRGERPGSPSPIVLMVSVDAKQNQLLEIGEGAQGLGGGGGIFTAVCLRCVYAPVRWRLQRLWSNVLSSVCSIHFIVHVSKRAA